MSDLLANDFRGTDPKTDPDGGSTSIMHWLLAHC
jgi:hypothetical protein